MVLRSWGLREAGSLWKFRAQGLGTKALRFWGFGEGGSLGLRVRV